MGFLQNVGSFINKVQNTIGNAVQSFENRVFGTGGSVIGTTTTYGTNAPSGTYQTGPTTTTTGTTTTSGGGTSSVSPTPSSGGGGGGGGGGGSGGGGSAPTNIQGGGGSTLIDVGTGTTTTTNRNQSFTGSVQGSIYGVPTGTTYYNQGKEVAKITSGINPNDKNSDFFVRDVGIQNYEFKGEPETTYTFKSSPGGGKSTATFSPTEATISNEPPPTYISKEQTGTFTAPDGKVVPTYKYVVVDANSNVLGDASQSQIDFYNAQPKDLVASTKPVPTGVGKFFSDILTGDRTYTTSDIIKTFDTIGQSSSEVKQNIQATIARYPTASAINNYLANEEKILFTYFIPTRPAQQAASEFGQGVAQASVKYAPQIANLIVTPSVIDFLSGNPSASLAARRQVASDIISTGGQIVGTTIDVAGQFLPTSVKDVALLYAGVKGFQAAPAIARTVFGGLGAFQTAQGIAQGNERQVISGVLTGGLPVVDYFAGKSGRQTLSDSEPFGSYEGRGKALTRIDEKYINEGTLKISTPEAKGYIQLDILPSKSAVSDLALKNVKSQEAINKLLEKGVEARALQDAKNIISEDVRIQSLRNLKEYLAKQTKPIKPVEPLKFDIDLSELKTQVDRLKKGWDVLDINKEGNINIKPRTFEPKPVEPLKIDLTPEAKFDLAHPRYDILPEEKIKVYHGTSSDYLKNILEKGLKPSSKTGIKTGILPKDFVSTGASLEAVRGFGARVKVGKPVILEANIPKSELDKLVYQGNEKSGIANEIRFKEIPKEYLSIYQEPKVIQELTNIQKLSLKRMAERQNAIKTADNVKPEKKIMTIKDFQEPEIQGGQKVIQSGRQQLVQKMEPPKQILEEAIQELGKVRQIPFQEMKSIPESRQSQISDNMFAQIGRSSQVNKFGEVQQSASGQKELDSLISLSVFRTQQKFGVSDAVSQMSRQAEASAQIFKEAQILSQPQAQPQAQRFRQNQPEIEIERLIYEQKRIGRPDLSFQRREKKISISKKQLYNVAIRRKGMFEPSAIDLSEGEAIMFGKRRITTSLQRTFKITKGREVDTTEPNMAINDIEMKPVPQFREYRISKGRQIATPSQFILKTKYLLQTPEQKALIQQAKQMAKFGLD